MNAIERGLLLILAGVVVFDHVGTAKAGGDARAFAGTEFTLLTDDGKIMGSFRISAEGLPELLLADAKGRGRIAIGAKANGDAILGITDSSGRVRAGFIGDAEGRYSMQLTDSAMVPRLELSIDSKGFPRIALASAKNKEIIGLGAEETGAPRFSITNEAGDARLHYGTTVGQDAFGLYLLGKGPAPRVGLEIDNSDASHVFAQDVAAKARVELQAFADSPPVVTLRDKSGKKLPLK